MAKDISSCVRKLCEFEFAFKEASLLCEEDVDVEFAACVDSIVLPTAEFDECCISLTNGIKLQEQLEILDHIVPFAASLSSISYAEAYDAMSDFYLANRL